MKQLLSDPNKNPTEEFLQSVMGDNFINFKNTMDIFERLKFIVVWNYYNDGKTWLCKVQYKKKTVLWLSVWEDCFKLSFFFTEKTKGGIDNLSIAQNIKSDFHNQKLEGKLIALVLEVRNNAILADIEKIINYKMNCN